MNLSTDARSSLPELVRLRREIHQYPEMGFQEKRTAALIEKTLKSAGVETKRVCGTGVVGLVKGAKPGPTLLIRADMDALPVTEENDVPYKSKIPGTMHA
jgi:metal-dependent amidase/aminoacylase/carboxypeptidase family protein